MWKPCQVDHLTSPSFADGIAPGAADDLMWLEVPNAFLAGRTECNPTLQFSDDQDREGYKENTLSIITCIHES